MLSELLLTPAGPNPHSNPIKTLGLLSVYIWAGLLLRLSLYFEFLDVSWWNAYDSSWIWSLNSLVLTTNIWTKFRSLSIRLHVTGYWNSIHASNISNTKPVASIHRGSNVNSHTRIWESRSFVSMILTLKSQIDWSFIKAEITFH